MKKSEAEQIVRDLGYNPLGVVWVSFLPDSILVCVAKKDENDAIVFDSAENKIAAYTVRVEYESSES